MSSNDPQPGKVTLDSILLTTRGKEFPLRTFADANEALRAVARAGATSPSTDPVMIELTVTWKNGIARTFSLDVADPQVASQDMATIIRQGIARERNQAAHLSRNDRGSGNAAAGKARQTLALAEQILSTYEIGDEGPTRGRRPPRGSA